MIFLTVGTQFPFDRLVKAVDELVGRNGFDEQIYAQIGDSSYQPRNFKAIPLLEKKVFDKHISEASCIVSHAGIGTIAMALDNEKPLLVMPRSRKYGEVVNDHQTAIARKFEQLGHILVAYDVEDLPDSLRKLKNFIPRKRNASPDAVANRIRRFLNSLQHKTG
jgi:UDP-N-acetylglucosamine transferase subunit ALG13